MSQTRGTTQGSKEKTRGTTQGSKEKEAIRRRQTELVTCIHFLADPEEPFGVRHLTPSKVRLLLGRTQAWSSVR
jgi:hypothetical protein